MAVNMRLCTHISFSVSEAFHQQVTAHNIIYTIIIILGKNDHSEQHYHQCHWFRASWRCILHNYNIHIPLGQEGKDRSSTTETSSRQRNLAAKQTCNYYQQTMRTAVSATDEATQHDLTATLLDL
jgi:hypothetical protein